MDLHKRIGELIQELRRIDKTIARLEKLPPMSRERSTRGRKSMPPEERLEVSKRLTAYWAKRRQLKRDDAV